jgi:hypothetical protein
MKLNKSPGLDGLTVEFYRAFWGKLKIVLTDIYNKSYNEALMSYSQLIVLGISPCSLITLLFSSSNLLIDFLTCLCFSKPKKYELFFSPNSTHFSLDLICAPFAFWL